MSKHIEQIKYDPETQNFFAKDKEGKVVHRGHVPPEELPNYVGKEMADKIAAGGEFSGLDIQTGGEGMKGFYDKILTDYLNTYGKQYGANVGQMDLPLGMSEESKRLINEAYARGTLADVNLAKSQAKMQTLPVHRFDITPQMREQIKTKGQPFYSRIGMGPEGLAAGTGAATIGAQPMAGKDEQPVQNPVHFTENPDAMLLELMQRN